MLTKEMRKPLLNKVLRECYGVEIGKEFDRSDLDRNKVAEKIQAYRWMLQGAFGLAAAPMLKKPLSTNEECIKLLRQMINALRKDGDGIQFEYRRQGMRTFMGKENTSRSIYLIK